MDEVYLCISVLGTGSLSGGFIASLILARTYDAASLIADQFIAQMESLGKRDRTIQELAATQANLTALGPRVGLITEDDEILMVSRMLVTQFPALAAHFSTHVGAVAIIPVTQDHGFPPDVLRTLRARMAKHHVAAALSVEI